VFLVIFKLNNPKMEEQFMAEEQRIKKSGIILIFLFCFLISLCINFLLFGNRVQKLVDKQELITDPAMNIETLDSGGGEIVFINSQNSN
jgi:hypothetical protein